MRVTWRIDGTRIVEELEVQATYTALRDGPPVWKVHGKGTRALDQSRSRFVKGRKSKSRPFGFCWNLQVCQILRKLSAGGKIEDVFPYSAIQEPASIGDGQNKFNSLSLPGLLEKHLLQSEAGSLPSRS
jgi:hypothetical protein